MFKIFQRQILSCVKRLHFLFIIPLIRTTEIYVLFVLFTVPLHDLFCWCSYGLPSISQARYFFLSKRI